MKLGASTLAGIEYEFEDTLEFIENLGLDYAEIVHQFPTEDVSTELLESFNLKYTIHAPFMDVNIASLQEKSRINSVEQIKDSIDFACEIDAEAVVVHPGLASFLANKYFLDDVYKYIEYEIGNGIKKEKSFDSKIPITERKIHPDHQIQKEVQHLIGGCSLKNNDILRFLFHGIINRILIANKLKERTKSGRDVVF